MMMCRRYSLDKFLEEEENKKRKNVLSNHLERIIQKTDKVASSMERYMNDVAKVDALIRKKFERTGVTADEYFRLTNSLTIILNRLEDMEKHIESLESLNF